MSGITHMKVAVMMAVHNSSAYLRAAADSVLAQSHSNLCLIMCDDGSSDDSWSIMEEYAARDSRVILLRNQVNMGVPATRNRMLAAAPEDAAFLAVLDSDDIARPRRLQLQLEYLLARPEISAVGASMGIIDEDGVRYASRTYPQGWQDMPRRAVSANPLAHSTLCFRRDILTELKGYDESRRSCEDYDFLMRLLCGHRFDNLPEELIDYRICRHQWKQTHLKRSLAATLSIQRPYLFRRGFRSLRGLLSHLAKYPLFLLPNRTILWLFQRLAYRRGGGRTDRQPSQPT